MTTSPSTSHAAVIRSRPLVVLVALLAMIAATVTISLSAGTDEAGASHTLVLDGSLADVKHNADASGSFVYNNDGDTDSPEGQVWVAETADAYWVAFEQSKSVKSNAYCEDKGNETENCSQDWGQLRGSDHIQLRWAESAFGQELAAGTDVIDEAPEEGPFTDAPFGIVGAGDSKETHWGDKKLEWDKTVYKGDLYQGDFAGSPIKGMSTLHYNHNTVGWTDLTQSPNFTSDPDDGAGFIYVSGAEFRIAKDVDPNASGQELPDGAAGTLADPNVISAEAHNSPEAEVTEDNPVENIECVSGDQDVDVGDTADVTFRAFENAQPAQGVQVLVEIASGDATIQSVTNPGSQANTGTTDSAGEVTATIEATGTGEISVRGVFDSDGDGDFDQAVEAADICLLTAGEAPAITATVDKTNDADDDGTFSGDEAAADGPGQDVEFQVVVTNTSSVNIVIDSLSDEFPDGATNATTIDLGGDSGLAANDCADLIGDTLAPDDAATCTFTAADYAPATADSPLDNRVFLEVHQENNPDNTATDDDDSRVRTTPREIDVAIDKRNDADGDGDYTDSETAPAPGRDVPFRVVVTNTGPEPIVIDRLVDRVPTDAGTRTLDLLTDAPFVRNTCDGLRDRVLAPGESTLPCFFTLDAYSPPRGEVKDDTAVVDVFLEGDDSVTDSARDDSRVRTPQTGEIDVQVIKTNDADRDGIYRDRELAPGTGLAVGFQAVVVNTGESAFDITELEDTFVDGDGTEVRIDLLASAASQDRLETNTCTALAGTSLAPGARTDPDDCKFTVAGYAPPEGSDKDDTVTVTVEDDAGNTDSDEDDSTVRTPAAGELTITLIKTNDANDDGQFNDFEFADEVGQAVEFELTIINRNDRPVTVTELTDVFPPGGGASVDLLTDDGLDENNCDTVLDSELASGETRTCRFTVADYASGTDDVVNEATITVTDGEQEASDSDLSTVGVPGEGIQPGVEEPPPAPVPSEEAEPRVTHPRTGIDSVALGGLSVLLLAIGAAVLALGQHRRRYGRA